MFFRSEITHIVVPTEANGVCCASYGIIQGILQGKWIVNCTCKYVFCWKYVPLCNTYTKHVKINHLTILCHLKNSCGVVKVMTESAALLLRILEVLDLNLGLHFGYHDLRFPSIPPGKYTSD